MKKKAGTAHTDIGWWDDHHVKKKNLRFSPFIIVYHRLSSFITVYHRLSSFRPDQIRLSSLHSLTFLELSFLFYEGSPSLCKYFSNIFSSTGSSKIVAAVYLRISSTGPLIFPYPSANLLEFQLILVKKKKSTSTEMGFNSYPNISQKWNWFQIFLSEMHESLKNGNRGVFS